MIREGCICTGHLNVDIAILASDAVWYGLNTLSNIKIRKYELQCKSRTSRIIRQNLDMVNNDNKF